MANFVKVEEHYVNMDRVDRIFPAHVDSGGKTLKHVVVLEGTGWHYHMDCESEEDAAAKAAILADQGTNLGRDA